MNFLQSVFLGLVQGITEFLPVSSSGHLMIFEQLMHFEGDIEFFNVFLHVGTLFAIMIGMQRDIVKLFKAFVAMAKDCFYNIRLFMKIGSSEKEPHYRRIISNNYRKLVLIIIIATIPTAIIGYVLNSFVGGGSYYRAASSRETSVSPGLCSPELLREWPSCRASRARAR